MRSGPFNLWMLRDPRNIMLEIGPHCLAPVLDLIGVPESLPGRARLAPVDLPGGRRFYRRWHVEAEADSAAIALQFSFAPGFTEQTIHVRGTLGSATVDLERNLYVLRRHTRYGMDFDRYRMDPGRGRIARGTGSADLEPVSCSRSSNSPPKGAPTASASRGPCSHSTPGWVGESIAGSRPRWAGTSSVSVPRSAGWASSSRRRPAAVTPSPPVTPTGRRHTAEILLLGATGFIGQELARQLLSEDGGFDSSSAIRGDCPRPPRPGS